MSVAIGLERSENIPDNLLLPVNQLEWLSGPCAFCMAKAFNEADRIIRSFLIVVGILSGKLRRFIFFQLTDSRSPPSKKHKNKPPSATSSVTRNRAIRLGPKGIFKCRCLVVVVQQDAKRHLCFLAGGFNVPASVVIAHDLTGHLDHQLADLATVDSVGLAGFLVVLHPIVADRVFILDVCIRDADGSFAPHIRHLLSSAGSGCPESRWAPHLPSGFPVLLWCKGLSSCSLLWQRREGFPSPPYSGWCKRSS